MSYVDWQEFWWNNITGANTVVNRVVMALLENKMVLLKVPSDLPWRYSMRSSIQAEFTEHTDAREVFIQQVDMQDDNPEGLEPGRFILDRFAPSPVRNGYREKGKVSLQEYITSREVIKNRIIWVKGLNDKTAPQWIQFCKKFSPKSAHDGLFVLEMHGSLRVAESRTMECIDFDECVSSYDLQLFNSFILDEQKDYSPLWKRYISTAAAMLCGVDAEVSELLLRMVDFRTESLPEGLQRVEDTGDFVRRGQEQGGNHVLWHLRNGNDSELAHRIWSAQVQVLFPLIELERVELIKKWETTIQAALQRDDVYQYGVKLQNPMDVELGTMTYMMSRRLDDGLYLLYIPEETDRQRIHFLHNCRNALAHANCCSPWQVTELIEHIATP